jgi:trigger factor
MKVTTERLENCQVHIFIEMDAAEVDKKLRETARKISRQFTVPGYRRGKAPYHAVVRVFGREAIQQQALEEFGNEWYEQALEQVEYDAYEVGSLEDVEWEPFRMKVLLPIEPEVDLGDYRAVRVPFEPDEITEERIEDYLADLQRQHAQWVPVERPAALGDQLVLDMEGKVGDRLFMSNEGYEMRLEEGASHPLPGFHQELVGLSPGEEKTFTLTVPEDDFDEDVSGQEGTITVRLHTVKAEDLPALDDELAMMVGDYDTLADLRVATRENLETEALQRAESEYLDRVLEAMIEAAVRIEYPPQAIDREADLALSQMERNLSASGIQLDTYLKMIGKTREVYKQELRPASEERLRKRLVLREVGRREALTVEPEEVEAEIERLVEGMGDGADEMRELLESPGGRLSVSEDLALMRIQERITHIAKGEAPPLEDDQEEVESEAPETVVAEDQTLEDAAQPEVAVEASGEAAELAVEVEATGTLEGDPEAELPEAMGEEEADEESEGEGTY